MKTNCSVCGSLTTVYRHERFGTFFICETCDYISKDAADYLTDADARALYELHENSIHDTRYINYFKDFIDKAIIPHASEIKIGLDYGSGPEPVLSHILETEYGYQMTCYDYFFACNPSYARKQYALITATEVVEHIENPLVLFALFKKLLAPRGTLAIMTSFHHKDLERFKNWHYMRDMTHISFFTPRTMRYIATAVGLKEVYCDCKRYITFTHL